MPDDPRKPRAAEKRTTQARRELKETRILQTPGGEILAVPGVEDGKTLSAAVLMAGIALFEPELLAGMAIGAGLIYASKWLPDLIGDVIAPVVGGVVRPVAQTAVNLGYATASKTQELVSHAVEGVEDMIAEARAGREEEEK